MGFLKRLAGAREEKSPIKAAVVGDGPEAGRLAAAYWPRPDIDLLGAEVLRHGDGSIRAPVIGVPPLSRLDDIIREPGLGAIEVVAPPADRFEAASRCIKAGLFTSADPPLDIDEVSKLQELARAYNTGLRFRLLHLYYPPYRELKRLIQEDAVGMPISLKMTSRRGKGTELPDPLDRCAFMAEHDLGFVALAQWLLGPIEKVHARIEPETTGGAPSSSMVMWKYKQRHQYGYLQLDFCPGLHVRSFHEPVARAIEFTGAGGVIFANRGEGQLLRMPALSLRAKSTMTSFEMVPECWAETHKSLAAEAVAFMSGKKNIAGKPQIAMDALRLIGAAQRSAEKGDEVEYA